MNSIKKKIKMKKKIQLIEAEINKVGDVVRISEELDQNYNHLVGIGVLSSMGTGSILSSSSVGGKELFPKNFEVEFIQTSSKVSPNNRFFKLEGVEAQGKKIEIDFQYNGEAQNYPIPLRIYLLLEK